MSLAGVSLLFLNHIHLSHLSTCEDDMLDAEQLRLGQGEV